MSKFPSKFLSIEELSAETGFPVRTLRTFVAAKKIPFFKIGHRTLRFDFSKVIKALEHFEVEAVK